MVPIFADYMALELRGGRLYYSFNLGSGRVFIVSNVTYNDGEIHTVSLHKHHVRISYIQLDNYAQ